MTRTALAALLALAIFASRADGQDRPDDGFAEATADLRAGRHEKARPVFERIVAASPDDLAARNNLAVCLIKARRFAEARLHLNSVLAKAPTRSGSVQNFGVAEFGVGRRDDALTQTRRALAQMRARKLTSDIAEALYNQGWLLDEQGDLDGAARSYREALDVRPLYPKAWLALGVTHGKAGRFQEAGVAFDRAAEQVGDDPELARLLTENRRLLAEALAPEPRDPPAPKAADPGHTQTTAPTASDSTATAASPVPDATPPAPPPGIIWGGILGVTGVAVRSPVVAVATTILLELLALGFVIGYISRQGANRTSKQEALAGAGAAVGTLVVLCGVSSFLWFVPVAGAGVLIAFLGARYLKAREGSAPPRRAATTPRGASQSGTFYCEAVDPRGNKVARTLKAKDSQDAMSQLKAQGLYPPKVKPAASDDGAVDVDAATDQGGGSAGQIRFECPSCHKKLFAKGQVVGMRTRCGKCGAVFRVPGA